MSIGDSIAFGKSVRSRQAWPALVAEQHERRLIDLAVSGPRRQVDAALRLHPDYIPTAATRNDRPGSCPSRRLRRPGVEGTYLNLGSPHDGHSELMQADGIHPNAAGQRVVAAAIENRPAPLDASL